jgi:hypothetical protein
MEPRIPKEHGTAGRWIAIFFVVMAVVLCALGIAYLDRTQISEALSNAKLIRTPAQYTELYFDNAASLPTSTLAGRPIAFSFTIHNVEGAPTVYPYVVYFAYPNGTQLVLAQGTISLPSDASTTVPVAYTFHTSNARGKIVVDLSSLNNQHIDFLLPNTNG